MHETLILSPDSSTLELSLICTIYETNMFLFLFEDTGMLGCHTTTSPIDPNVKLSAKSGDLHPDLARYQRLVGRLIYLINTHHDLTNVVSVVSQFMHAPHTCHIDVVCHVLKYLESCPGLG